MGAFPHRHGGIPRGDRQFTRLGSRQTRESNRSGGRGLQIHDKGGKTYDRGLRVADMTSIFLNCSLVSVMTVNSWQVGLDDGEVLSRVEDQLGIKCGRPVVVDGIVARSTFVGAGIGWALGRVAVRLCERHTGHQNSQPNRDD